MTRYKDSALSSRRRPRPIKWDSNHAVESPASPTSSSHDDDGEHFSSKDLKSHNNKSFSRSLSPTPPPSSTRNHATAHLLSSSHDGGSSVINGIEEPAERKKMGETSTTTTVGGVAGPAILSSSTTSFTSRSNVRYLHEEIAKLHQMFGLQTQEIELLQDEIQTKEALVQRLQEQNDDLLRNHQLAQHRLLRLEQELENDSRVTSKGTIQERLLEEEKERERLKGHLDRATRQLRECLETIEGLELTLKQVEKERDFYQREMEKLRSEQEGHQRGNEELYGEINHYKLEKTHLENENTLLMHKISRLEKNQEKLEKENRKLRHSIQDLQQSKVDLSASRIEQESLAVKCQELEALLTKSQEIDRANIEQNQEQVSKLQQERHRLLVQDEKLREKLTEAEKKLLSYQERMSRLEAKIRRYKKREERGDGGGASSAMSGGEVQEIRFKCREYLQTMTEMVEELERIKKERGRKNQQIQHLREACTSLEEEKRELKHLWLSEKDRGKELEKLVQETAEKILQYQEEVQRTKADMQETLRELENLQKLTSAAGKASGGGYHLPSFPGAEGGKKDEIADILLRSSRQIQLAVNHPPGATSSGRSSHQKTPEREGHDAADTSRQSPAVEALLKLRDKVSKLSSTGVPLSASSSSSSSSNSSAAATSSPAYDATTILLRHGRENLRKNSDKKPSDDGIVVDPTSSDQSFNAILHRCQVLKEELKTAVEGAGPSPLVSKHTHTHKL